MSFDGEALKLLGELSQEIMHSYDKLVEELNRRYDPAERAQAWKIEFRNRTRKLNETVMQYAQALKRLVLKAFPNMGNEAQEQWVVDQFNLGLGSVELRRHVQFGHPHDLNEAISLAIEFEAFEAGNKDKLKKPINKSAEVSAVSSSPPPEVANDDRPKPESRGRDTWKGEGAMGSLENPSWGNRKVECRYCKKVGHILQDCRKLKWKREQEAKKNGENSETPKQNQGN